ncbi:MAG: hypothetical protein LBV15_00865 [Planctomycetota bacterium]|jgi:hypothetical protein|nr:hypothetical protein [Planctomycetota bacterium]
MSLNVNIRDQVMTKGFSGLSGMASDLTKAIETTDTNDQVAFLKLQQQMASYTNTISLMSNMLKGLSDTDKEVIRNT